MLTQVKNQKHMIDLLLAHPEDWLTFSFDLQTTSIVCALSNLGILTVNDFNQVKLKSRENALAFLSAKEEASS